MKQIWRSITRAYKYLLIITVMCFIVICYSIFDSRIVNGDDIIIIRTVFSSILGAILETATRPNVDKKGKKTCICINIEEEADKKKEANLEKYTNLRVILIGSVAIGIIIILVGAMMVQVGTTNNSLVLLKNTLFSCIGFLISTSKRYDYVE